MLYCEAPLSNFSLDKGGVGEQPKYIFISLRENSMSIFGYLMDKFLILKFSDLFYGLK